MSNIFEYKPILKYVLEDIDSINNLPDAGLDRVKPYILNNASDTLQRIKDTRELLKNIDFNIENVLKDISIPFDANLLDEITKGNIRELHDGNKLLNDGILTYDLYKRIGRDPSHRTVKDIWDEYHAGKDGLIEAELLPFVVEIDNQLDRMKKAVEQTVVYDLKTTDLKESELLYIEEYLRLTDELSQARKNGDGDKIRSFKRRIEYKEHKLTHKKNLILGVKSTLPGIENMTRGIFDATLPEYHILQQKMIDSQLEEIRRNTSITDTGLKLILYNALLDKKNTVLEARKNKENVFSEQVKNRVLSHTIRDSRVYLDVALPAVTDLCSAPDSLPMDGAGRYIVEGLERMTKLYEKSMLEFKNILAGDSKNINKIVTMIFDKNKARIMYKLTANK